jgi:glycosyltransferase involved in cell wall biosynthesis
MKKTVTVSIGIPAYNEAKNIGKLLNTLLSQKEEGITLKEIIVASDGSSDNTANVVKALKDKRIKLLDDGKRLGKSARLDQMFRKFTGDVLFLLDADILIKDNKLLAKTVQIANLKKHGLAGINARPLPAKTFFQKSLEMGVNVMKNITVQWRDGNNYLAYKGCFLALDAKLAKAIHMPAEIVNNDPFLYFSAVKHGYEPVYIEDCYAYYQSPLTFKDHLKQSSRFQMCREEMEKYFILDLQKEFAIPLELSLMSSMKIFVQNPIAFVSYVLIQIATTIKKQRHIKSTWSVASSTKGKMSL